MSKLQPVRGTHDLIGKEAALFHQIVETAQRVGALYGFEETVTPIFEFTDVFKRTLGETSDVVNKEMYTFEDRGGESITLRPEFTAGIARAFISNGWQQHLPLKLFSAGPLFRYERPQKGRQRQFHQVNFEWLGEESPFIDAQIICMAADFLWEIIFKNNKQLHANTSLHINTLGSKESRLNYTKALVDYLSKYAAELSEDSKLRLQKNPLRILDSKDENDKKILKDAPKFEAHLLPEDKRYFDQVLAALKAVDFRFNINLNQHLVRGLDYYNHTVFEFVSSAAEMGAQNTLLAGGRYDGLIAQMGGPATPAVGFAAGIERLMLLVDAPATAVKPIAIIALGEMTISTAFALAQQLRIEGRTVELIQHNNPGKALKKADKIKAGYAVLLGENELASGQYIMKNLTSGMQETIAKSAIVNYLLAAKEESYAF